jgi:thiamine-monophosphate kinase
MDFFNGLLGRSMRVAQLGERRMIEALLRPWPSPAPPALARDVPVGPGDDCAMVRGRAGAAWLVTTDQLIEDTHFDWSWSTAAQLGRRAGAVTLSDIAAMGGIPRYLLVSLGLPPRTQAATVTRFYGGLRRMLSRYKVQLIGGDTAAARRFHAAMTAIGEIDPRLAVTRSGARPGDCLMVTGTLGDAAAGLQILRRRHLSRGRGGRGRPAIGSVRALVRRQLIPTPRLAAGRLLAVRRLATAMLDLSDGLMIDLDRLCRASGVGATLFAERLPLSPALIAYGRATRQNPLRLALAGGEDYELLFTVRPAAAARCTRLLRRLRLSCRLIGTITRATPHRPSSGRAPAGAAIAILSAGRLHPLRSFTAAHRIYGFEHFHVPARGDGA